MDYKPIPETRIQSLKIQGEWQCPSCMGVFSIKDDFPALSRWDNKTHICSNCGIVEAFADHAKHKLEKLNMV